MNRNNLSFREALATDQLEDFVRQEEGRGAELTRGSELERALALLITQYRGGRSSRPVGNGLSRFL